MAASQRNVTIALNSTISINEQRESYDNIHKVLHRNLYLLSLKFPMKDGFKNCFAEGMLKTSNSLAFNHVAHYLISIIDNQYSVTNLDYILCEPKMAAQFRREFLSFVNEIAKLHKGFVSPIMPSWLVTPGGSKVAKLMFELTQVALKVCIQKSSKIKMIDFESMLTDITIEQKIQKHKEELSHKCYQRNKYLDCMEQISIIYRDNIEMTQNDINAKTALLTDFIAEVKENIDEEDYEYLESLLCVDSSDLIDNWNEYIDDAISTAEKDWNNISDRMNAISNRCEDTCKESIQRYTQTSNKDTILEYNPETDKLPTNLNCKNVASDDLKSILNKVVDNGVLNLPNLFKAYNMILRQNFRVFSVFRIDKQYFVAIQNKKKAIRETYEQARQLEREVENMLNKLKTSKDYNMAILKHPEDYNWIQDAFNIPSIKILPYNVKHIMELEQSQ